MKILLINESDMGGAAKSCIRLHLGLLKEGLQSKLLLRRKTDDSIPESYEFKQAVQPIKFHQRVVRKIKRDIFKIQQRNHFDYVKNRPNGYEIFSPVQTPYAITDNELFREADIINLHWVAGFVDFKSFFRNINKPVVWTLHDTFAFTGGCHYTYKCRKYQTDCEDCPQLQGTIDANYSAEQLSVKRNALKSFSNLSVMCPSIWLTGEAKKSILFKKYPVHTVPYGLDSDVFTLRQKEACRKMLNIPDGKKVLLFVSDLIENSRKGYHLLVEALTQIEDENLILLAIGKKSPHVNNLCNCVELGEIKDEKMMSQIYSAADGFVIPSMEDNLPNTVLESLMCGTPVIGFPIGGIPDMVTDGENGYICEDTSIESLQGSIHRFCRQGSSFNREKIRDGAVKKYNLLRQAKDYRELFEQLLG